MNDSRNKTSVIPKFVYALAGVVYVAGYLAMRYAAIPSDPKSVDWPEGGKVLLSLFIPLIIVGYILLIGYVYGDAKRRLMRAWLWTLLAIFIPNAIGIILYFFLRDPMPFYCSKCGASVKSAYTFCPNCAASLRPTCFAMRTRHRARLGALPALRRSRVRRESGSSAGWLATFAAALEGTDQKGFARQKGRPIAPLVGELQT